MFEAKLGSSALLKKIVDAIKDLVTDGAPFDCSENAFCLQAMDSSHVALVSLKMEVGLFETYRCDRTINLGINLANMAKALKCANNEDTCKISYSDSDTQELVFSFADIKREKTQQVSVKLMDIDSEHLGIPDQDYSCVIRMPSFDFQKVVKDLSTFSDSITIAATKGNVTFSCNGDSGACQVTYSSSANADEDTSSVVDIELAEPVAINFSIKYLKQFTNATGLCEMVKLSLSNDNPIVVEYELYEPKSKDDKEKDDKADPPEAFGYLRYYLAPKIEDEDNKADADMA